MKIRRANISDIESIAVVHVDTWRSTYRGIVPDQFFDELSYEKSIKRWREYMTRDENPFHCFVAEKGNGEIVGFSIGGKLRVHDDHYDCEISGIYVLEQFQRKGIGRELIKETAKVFMSDGYKSMLSGNLSTQAIYITMASSCSVVMTPSPMLH